LSPTIYCEREVFQTKKSGVFWEQKYLFPSKCVQWKQARLKVLSRFQQYLVILDEINTQKWIKLAVILPCHPRSL